MDINKLNLIKKDLLKYPFDRDKKRSDDFCGLCVDGTGNVTLAGLDAFLNSFYYFSLYQYPVFLLVSVTNNKEELKNIVQKYPYTIIVEIPPLTTIEYYSEWMFNYCFQYISPRFEKIFTFQEDGGLIKSGWEEFVTKGNYDFIGAPWKSKIRVIAENVSTAEIQVCNGGVSFRKRSSMLKVLDFINNHGGQHRVFKGLEIDRRLRQYNSWLAEDAMFSIGFCLDMFKVPTIEECSRFSLEPITLNHYLSQNNLPFAFHKIDE